MKQTTDVNNSAGIRCNYLAMMGHTTEDEQRDRMPAGVHSLGAVAAGSQAPDGADPAATIIPAARARPA
jgi:hypothetical protein